ncbi:hypothetical protein ACLMJK_008754 [Lecanora helva]
MALHIIRYFLILVISALVESSTIPNDTYFGWDDISNSSLSASMIGGKDDPRFSMSVSYGHTDLPLIPTFVNAIELMAQYAEMDPSSRIRSRTGTVLPGYPQVEIAAVPEAPHRTIEVRLLIYAIYGLMIDMKDRKLFKEAEVTVMWSEAKVAFLYFTIPLDLNSIAGNQTSGLDLSRLEGIADSKATLTPDLSSTGTFSWRPVFTANAKNLPAQDIFILCLGTLKVFAPLPVTDKVDGAFHVASQIVDANLQGYLQNRRTPRTKPPYFQVAHVIEAVRRIPGYMLAQKRFAEFYCNIQVSSRPVGHLLIEKGAFVGLDGPSGNVSVS